MDISREDDKGKKRLDNKGSDGLNGKTIYQHCSVNLVEQHNSNKETPSRWRGQHENHDEAPEYSSTPHLLVLHMQIQSAKDKRTVWETGYL